MTPCQRYVYIYVSIYIYNKLSELFSFMSKRTFMSDSCCHSKHITFDRLEYLLLIYLLLQKYINILYSDFFFFFLCTFYALLCAFYSFY